MSCCLCGLNTSHLIIEQEKSFCCTGCRAVFRILEMKGELANKEHPLFLQAVKSGLITKSSIASTYENQTERLLLEIGSMWCTSCAEVIEYFLQKMKGVVSCRVDYATDLSLIEYDPKAVGPDKIFEMILNLGYKPLSVTSTSKDRTLLFRLGIASFCALNLMMFTYPLYFAIDSQQELKWLSFLFTLPIVGYAAYPFYRRAYNGLRANLFGMDLLVTLGILSSFTLSLISWEQSKIYFDTLAVTVSFLLFGKWLESGMKEGSRDRLISLIKHIPQKIRRASGEKVLLKDIKVGDDLLVGLGEMIPMNGVIVSGEGWISEKAINGEAESLFRKEKEEIKSGSTVVAGSFQMRVSEVYQNSLIHQIMEACEHSFKSKRQVNWMEKWLKGFVPVVIGVSFFTFFAVGGKEALAVLLISCPCAIGIASPLVESRLLRAFASKGALVKNRNAFQALATADLFVFDKTGTITAGNLVLREPIHNSALIHGLTKISSHPLAKTLYSQTKEGVHFDKLSEIPGKGITGEKDGSIYHLGSAAYLKENGIEVEKKDLTHVILAKDYKPIEYFEFEDTLKEDLDLPSPRFLLSGDQEKVVAHVAKTLHFDGWKSEKTPLEKEKFIKEQKGVTIFIGDGINDAPSLAAASCGIAVGDSLSLTQASADILLNDGKISEIKELCRLAQRGKKIIKQNIFWAFSYNALAIPFAVLGFLTPLIATMIMVVSSLIVMMNSQRVR